MPSPSDITQVDVPNIVDVIEQLKNRIKDDVDDLKNIESLDEVLNDPSLQALLEVHERIQIDESRRLPANKDSLQLTEEVHELAGVFSDNDILSVLSTLLHSSPHLLSLLSCHDQIANKEYGEPLLAEETEGTITDDEQSGEESMKVVRLVKGDEPLGATIATEESSDNIIIARILKGGAADRSGLIHVNDVVVEVNGMLAKGRQPEELIKELAGFRGPLTFKLIPGETGIGSTEENLFLRAKFTFSPQKDTLIPCPDAGISFNPGDVLKVVSKDDSSWWQAAKVNTDLPASTTEISTTRAGLIPSVKLQTRREKLKRQSTLKQNNVPSVRGSNASLLSSHRKSAWSVIRASFRRKRSGTLNKNSHSSTAVTQPDPPFYPPYEVVSLMPPTNSGLRNGAGEPKLRPVVLVGPQGVGRNELKDRLIDSNPSHYGVPVPHTSRAKLSDELDGQDYHFVTRDYMEAGIKDKMFLEYGEYRGNLYGTSLEAVRNVIGNGQVCVLTPYPQALSTLRTKQFKPFIVYVKPPTMKLANVMAKEDSGIGDADTKARLTMERQRPFTDEELNGLVWRGEKMEQNYGRLFDHVIVNDDIDASFQQLKEICFALENDPQWVPAEWAS